MDVKDKILQELTVLFRKELEEPELQLTYASSPSSVEKWDSMSNLLLISAIEEQFNVQIPVEFIFSMNNIGDLCEFLVQNSSNGY
jgi:acyl carrier protein